MIFTWILFITFVKKFKDAKMHIMHIICKIT